MSTSSQKEANENLGLERRESEPAILVVDPSKKHYITRYQVYYLSFEFWYVILGIVSLCLSVLSLIVIGITFVAATKSDDELDCDKLTSKLKLLQMIQYIQVIKPKLPALSCTTPDDIKNLQIFVKFLDEQQLYYLMLFSLIYILQLMMTVHNILVITYYKYKKQLILNSFYLSFLVYFTMFLNQSLFVILQNQIYMVGFGDIFVIGGIYLSLMIIPYFHFQFLKEIDNDQLCEIETEGISEGMNQAL